MFSMVPLRCRSEYWVYGEVSVLAVTKQLGMHARLKGTKMTQNQWEPLARLSTTAEAIDALRDLFAAEEPLDDASARVAATASHAIPNNGQAVGSSLVSSTSGVSSRFATPPSPP